MVARGINLRLRRTKEATRLLHEGVGGLAEAAKVTGKSTTQHGRFQSATDPDFATLRDVIEMEAVAERGPAWPPVTRLLCELAGGVYLPLPDVDAHDGPVALGLVTLMKEFGDLAAAVHEGSADGTFAPDELMRARREGGELQTALAAYLRMLDQQIEANPPSGRALREVAKQ